MKTVDREAKYRCLDCGGKFRGRIALSIRDEVLGRVLAYKCPMCRSGRFEPCSDNFEGELVWGEAAEGGVQ